MRKVILTVVCGLLASDLYAVQKPESSSVDFIRQLNALPVAVQAAAVSLPVSAPVKVKSAQYVQVSGYINLTGNGFMPQNGGFTSVTLSGWATFRDSTGKITSNNTYINVIASMFINPNQYVFQTVWPNVSAQFYRDGKPVGSTSMSGSISVSGFPSSNFVTLNGTGNLTGSIYVEDEK